MARFTIDAIALAPPDAAKAIELLTMLGLDEWSSDIAKARGITRGSFEEYEAELHFNTQATAGTSLLEIVDYKKGPPWFHESCVSHLGTHCTADDLKKWKAKFAALGIAVAKEAFTHSHTNPAIAGKREYHYVIFDTRDVLGVDLEFIVRRDVRTHHAARWHRPRRVEYIGTAPALIGKTALAANTDYGDAENIIRVQFDDIELVYHGARLSVGWRAWPESLFKYLDEDAA